MLIWSITFHASHYHTVAYGAAAARRQQDRGAAASAASAASASSAVHDRFMAQDESGRRDWWLFHESYKSHSSKSLPKFYIPSTIKNRYFVCFNPRFTVSVWPGFQDRTPKGGSCTLKHSKEFCIFIFWGGLGHQGDTKKICNVAKVSNFWGFFFHSIMFKINTKWAFLYIIKVR